jgi:hypothetical protein
VSAAWTFAEPVGETPRERSRRIGAAKRVYDAIRCDYPPHTDAVEDILSVLHAAQDRPPGSPCGGGFLVAPIGTGKSETLRMAELEANRDAADGTRPALRIEIGTRGTTDVVPQAILAAFGAKRPDAGKESAQWDRAVEAMRRHDVGILLLDEFNRAARRPTMSAAIAIGIQERIMDASVCPVVLAGSEKAATVLRGAPAVHERLDDCIDLQPLVWERDADKELVAEFLAELDDRMVQTGIMLRHAGLDGGDVPRLLCRSTRGKLRAIVKTVRVAMVTALQRGACSIDREDVAEGVSRYCVRQRLIARNPFRDPSGKAPTGAGSPGGTPGDDRDVADDVAPADDDDGEGGDDE